MEARFQVGDLVQRIWNGPGSVYTVRGVIRIPPARWDTEGTEQIAYQIVTTRGYWDSNAVVNEEDLKSAVNPVV